MQRTWLSSTVTMYLEKVFFGGHSTLPDIILEVLKSFFFLSGVANALREFSSHLE